MLSSVGKFISRIFGGRRDDHLASLIKEVENDIRLGKTTGPKVLSGLIGSGKVSAAEFNAIRAHLVSVGLFSYTPDSDLDAEREKFSDLLGTAVNIGLIDLNEATELGLNVNSNPISAPQVPMTSGPPLISILRQHFGADFPISGGANTLNDPLVITDPRDYVGVEYAVANFVLELAEESFELKEQRTHRANGRVVDELVFNSTRRGEGVARERRFFFDVSAGFARGV